MFQDFLILMGKVTLLVGKDGKEYGSGAVITVPKGIKRNLCLPKAL